MGSWIDFKKLPLQLVLSFLAVVLLSSALVGLPGIWLLQAQLDRQIWAQTDQAKHSAFSLFEKKNLELENTAILIAQRPTLSYLLQTGDEIALEDYLNKLQSTAGIDLIQICRSGEMIAGTDLDPSYCDSSKTADLLFKDGTAWLMASAPIAAGDQRIVIVGFEMDKDYIDQIASQIGMDTGLIWDQRVQLSSFPNPSPEAGVEECINQGLSKHQDLSCSQSGKEYHLIIFPAKDPALSSFVALDTSQIHQIRQQVVGWMVIAIIGVAGFGSMLGVISSRRISRPLVTLSQAAGTLSRGDLESPVHTSTKIWEITQVARAMEDARLDLRDTLRSLANERDWRENLLASIIEGIIILDHNGRITFFSHGAERLTGFLEDDVRGRHLDQVLPVINQEAGLYQLVSSGAEKYQRVDVQISKDTIATLAITNAKLPTPGEEDHESALVIRDISKEEAINRLLGQFIASAAHELRTPLTALEASIELLLDPEQDLTSEEEDQLYTSLHLGIFKLHNLVDNLLESANIEARRFRISPRITDLSLVISEAVQTMRPLLYKYDHKITTEMPLDLPSAYADRKRVVQVLVNLISNANKYSPSQEEIRLEARVEGDCVRISVLDRGPGIPPDQRDGLFERFVYPNQESEISQAGAGLGLSVVKAIVEAHGGEVGVKDRAGGGSEFWFSLPARSEG
jgi:PAS domain S-box-containing protein